MTQAHRKEMGSKLDPILFFAHHARMRHLPIIMIALVITALAALPPAQAMSKKVAPPKLFEGTQAWDKMDLRAREAYREAVEKKDGARRFECMLKTTHRMSADEEALLKGAGYERRSVIGDIVTGSVTAAHLQSVAELPFVQAMELAVPLQFK